MGKDDVFRAFDEERFGASRTLNLRAQQPTVLQATAQTEQWLRRLQVEGAREALVITGRGNQSIDGYSPVREAIAKLLASLRRRNVLSGYTQHTPGSFVVEFARVSDMLEAGKRRREKRTAHPTARSGVLAELEAETIQGLHELAIVTLARLGVSSPNDSLVEQELLRQFSRLVAALPNDSNREALLQQAVQRALEELE